MRLCRLDHGWGWGYDDDDDDDEVGNRGWEGEAGATCWILLR